MENLELIVGTQNQ